MIRNKFSVFIAATIGAVALTVILVILKCFGVPLTWLAALMPAIIFGGLWAIGGLVFAIVVLVWAFQGKC